MGWIIAGAVLAVMTVIDWFIIMGRNPKHWKGGGQKDDQGGGSDR